MLICTCPIDEDCIALGSNFDCFPWCDYLKDDGVKDNDGKSRKSHEKGSVL